MEPVLKPPVEVFSPWVPGTLSLAIYALLILGMVVLILFLTSWLGVKNPRPEKLRAYESGIIPSSMAKYRYPVAFYLMATFFLIFDVESAYIYSWAIAFERLGWLGWLQIAFFIIVLMVSLFYIWMKGGLEWGPKAPRQ